MEKGKMGLQVFKVALLSNKNHAREESILNLRHGAMSHDAGQSACRNNSQKTKEDSLFRA